MAVFTDAQLVALSMALSTDAQLASRDLGLSMATPQQPSFKCFQIENLILACPKMCVVRLLETH